MAPELDLDLEDLDGDPSTSQYLPASIGARIAAAGNPPPASTPVQQTPDAAEAKLRETQTNTVGNKDVGFQPRSSPMQGGTPIATPIRVRPDTRDIPIPQTREQAQGNPAGPPPQIQLDPSKMPPGILRSDVTPNEIPSPAASSPTNTTLPGLMQRRSQLAQPIDPNATDASGKKIYRMGTGQRILGTVGNFLTGFGGGRGPITYVGPGATNSRFERDTAMQQQRLGAIDTDIGNQEKLSQQQRQLYDDATKQAYEAQLGEARETTANAQEGKASAAQELADTKAQLTQSQKDLNAARAAQASSTANQKDATRPTKVMGMWTYEKGDDNAWHKIGPAPTKQFNPNTGRGNKSDFDKIEADHQKAIHQAENKAQTSIMKIKPPSPMDYGEYAEYSRNPQAWKESKKQEIYQQLDQDKQQAEADYQARIKEKGGSIVNPPAQRTINTPPPNRVNPPAGGGNKNGQVVTYKGKQYTIGQTTPVDGKPHRVLGFNSKTNKLIVDPNPAK